MLKDLNREELQELVFMAKSKKAFATYLGVDVKEAELIWREKGLMLPLEWLRSQSRLKRLNYLADLGSYKRLANYIGASEAAVKEIFKGKPQKSKLDWSAEELERFVRKFGSVKLAARCTAAAESDIRKRAKELGMELVPLLNYQFSEHSNAKGRRAELEWATLEGSLITADLNLTEGSQATADFTHSKLGRVNVKSSRQYRYKARTRRTSPHYWKFSTNGRENCDYFVVLCYDSKMKELVGIKTLKASSLPDKKSIQLGRHEFDGIPTSEDPG